MEHDIRSLYKIIRELDESMASSTVSYVGGIPGEAGYEYKKWRDGGIDAWKQHIENIFGPLDYTHKADIRGRDDFSQTKALKNGEEVGSFSHYNNSSSNLVKAPDELADIKRLSGQ